MWPQFEEDQFVDDPDPLIVELVLSCRSYNVLAELGLYGLGLDIHMLKCSHVSQFSKRELLKLHNCWHKSANEIEEAFLTAGCRLREGKARSSKELNARFNTGRAAYWRWHDPQDRFEPTATSSS